MSEMPDIAKIVSMIMENPKLIEEISAMVKPTEENKEASEPAALPASNEVDTKSAENKEPDDIPEVKKNRTKLLSALKPYVSKERAQAIDSMITVVSILDTMKRR